MTLGGGNYLKKGVTYNAKGEFKDCVFCRIGKRDPNEPARVVLENEKFMTFRPRHPVTLWHLLIIPKAHVQNVSSLQKGPKDAQMIKEMVEFAKESLGTVEGGDKNDVQLSFHVPPFNSIDHLHLHAIGRPRTMSFMSWITYFQDGLWCKSAEKLIQELESQI